MLDTQTSTLRAVLQANSCISLLKVLFPQEFSLSTHQWQMI